MRLPTSEPAPAPPPRERSLWDRAVSAGTALVELTGDAVRRLVWSLLEAHAPQLVPILRRGVVEWLKERLGEALHALMNVLARPVRTRSDLVNTAHRHFLNLMRWLAEAAAKIARNDCSSITEAAGYIQQAFEGFTGGIIDQINSYIDAVKSFFDGLWNRFGAPVWQWLQEVGGAIWEQIRRVGNWIWEQTAPIREAVSAAWTWFKNLLGIGEGEEGQNGILQWFQRQAAAAWEWVSERLQPYKRQILIAVAIVGGILIWFSPLGPLAVAFVAGAAILRGIQWIRQNMTRPGGVVQQQLTLRTVILPPVLRTLDRVGGIVQEGAASIIQMLRRMVGTLEAMRDAVLSIPLIRMASSLVGFIVSRFQSLLGWAMTGIRGLSSRLRGGLRRLGGFARQLIDFLEEIYAVTRDIFRNFYRLGGRIWNAISPCIRDPFVDWFIPLILRQVPFFAELGSSPEAWQQTRTQITALVRQVFQDFDLLAAMRTAFGIVLRVLRIPVDLLLELLDKAALAWDSVFAAPLAFIENSIRSILRGIYYFFLRIGSHLAYGISAWLFRVVSDAGITPPSDWTNLREVFNFILGVLGLSVDNVINMLVRNNRLTAQMAQRIRTVIRVVSNVLDWLGTALNEGATGVWNRLVATLTGLGTSIIESAIGFVTTRIIANVSARLTAAAASAGLTGVLEAIKFAWSAFSTFMQYLPQILRALIVAFDTIHQIATGNIEPGALGVERGMRISLPFIINFLAEYVGLGGISNRIREIIGDVRQRIERGILMIWDRAAAAVRSLLDLLRRGVQAVRNWWQERVSFRARDGVNHELFFQGSADNADLMFASGTPRRYADFVNQITVPAGNTELATAKSEALRIAREIDSLKRRVPGTGMQAPEIITKLRELSVKTAILAGASPADPPSVIEYGNLTGDGGGTFMNATVLSRNRTAGSTPSDRPLIFLKAIRRPGTSPSAPMYVRGHLLNENLGGPGRAYNLTPITGTGYGGHNANSDHLHRVESTIKRHVLGEGVPASVVRYRVGVNYGGHPTRTLQTTLSSVNVQITQRIGTSAELPTDAADLALNQRKLEIMHYEQNFLARELVTEWKFLKYENGQWVDDNTRAAQPVTPIPNDLPDSDFTPASGP